jgi:hypothetical protein
MERVLKGDKFMFHPLGEVELLHGNPHFSYFHYTVYQYRLTDDGRLFFKDVDNNIDVLWWLDKDGITYNAHEKRQKTWNFRIVFL